MKKIVGLMTLLSLTFSIASTLKPEPAEAQVLLATGRYRVVSVDRAEQRIGIARPDDNPKVRQNWVYIKPDTVMVRRHYAGNGYFKDEFLTFNGIFDTLSHHQGGLVKVHGGRDWDGSIKAKKIWM